MDDGTTLIAFNDRVSSLITSFEKDSDPRKAEAVTVLRRILSKQKRKQQKDAVAAAAAAAATADGTRMEE